MHEPIHPDPSQYYDEDDYREAVGKYEKDWEDYNIWCDMEYDRRRDDEMERDREPS